MKSYRKTRQSSDRLRAGSRSYGIATPASSVSSVTGSSSDTTGASSGSIGVHLGVRRGETQAIGAAEYDGLAGVLALRAADGLVLEIDDRDPADRPRSRACARHTHSSARPRPRSSWTVHDAGRRVGDKRARALRARLAVVGDCATNASWLRSGDHVAVVPSIRPGLGATTTRCDVPIRIALASELFVPVGADVAHDRAAEARGAAADVEPRRIGELRRLADLVLRRRRHEPQLAVPRRARASPCRRGR